MRNLKRFYILLSILAALIIFLVSFNLAEAKEMTINGIKNEISEDDQGFISSICYINNAILTKVKKGICTSYNQRTSHANYQFQTLDGFFDILFTKEIIGSEYSEISTSKHIEYTTTIMDITYLRSIGKNSLADLLEKLINK